MGIPDTVTPLQITRYERVDSTLPGKHTRLLYDRLSRKKASVLAQLRTGMARLNAYLAKEGAFSEECVCLLEMNRESRGSCEC